MRNDIRTGEAIGKAWAGRRSEIRFGGGNLTRDDLHLTGASASGFFLIRANDYDEAAAIAETCPFLLRGGTLELRELVR